MNKENESNTIYDEEIFEEYLKSYFEQLITTKTEKRPKKRQSKQVTLTPEEALIDIMFAEFQRRAEKFFEEEAQEILERSMSEVLKKNISFIIGVISMVLISLTSIFFANLQYGTGQTNLGDAYLVIGIMGLILTLLVILRRR